LKWLGIIAIVSLILLSGCAQEKFVCNEPYIQVGDACCLDENNNNICDSDENSVSVPNTANQELNEPEEAISCEDKCEGTTFYSDGKANGTECGYETIIENSVDCGYEEEIPPVIQIVEMGCRYAYNSSFLAHFKSISETPVPVGSSIKLLLDDGNSKTYSISSEYANGQRIWQDVSLRSGWDTQGRNFDFKGINSSNFGRKNQNYAYIYCPVGLDKNDCDKSNGLVLYEGNAIADCGTEIRNYGYFTPYNDFIKIADEKPVVSAELKALSEKNLKKTDFSNGFSIVEKFSGTTDNVEYYSDLNKAHIEKLIERGWIANNRITIANSELDTKIQLMLPSEQVYSSISEYSKINSPKEVVKESLVDYSDFFDNKEEIIESYESADYKDVVIELHDSNVTKSKILFFSYIDKEQTLGSGKYTTISTAFNKGNYFVSLIVEGYSDSITIEKIEEYAQTIMERLS